MENSIYLGLSRQMTLRTNMDIIANNVANMNTPGYRGQNLLFKEYISNPRGADDPLSFVYNQGQYQVSEAGSVRQTENPLDFALVGPGFIGVQAPGDEPAYTRAGNLQIGANGELQTSAGFGVIDSGGAVITIPKGSREINIDEKGVISNQGGEFGRIKIVEFDNIQELRPMGNNIYTTEAVSGEATKTRIKQGYLESSNVKPIIEMTRMVETLRSYQSVQNILKIENDRLRGAIQKLTRG